jgi:hypothetical protein
VKVYVAAVEALRKKERQDETQFTTKIDDFMMQIVCIQRLSMQFGFCTFVKGKTKLQYMFCE